MRWREEHEVDEEALRVSAACAARKPALWAGAQRQPCSKGRDLPLLLLWLTAVQTRVVACTNTTWFYVAGITGLHYLLKPSAHGTTTAMSYGLIPRAFVLFLLLLMTSPGGDAQPSPPPSPPPTTIAATWPGINAPAVRWGYCGNSASLTTTTVSSFSTCTANCDNSATCVGVMTDMTDGNGPYVTSGFTQRCMIISSTQVAGCSPLVFNGNPWGLYFKSYPNAADELSLQGYTTPCLNTASAQQMSGLVSTKWSYVKISFQGSTRPQFTMYSDASCSTSGRVDQVDGLQACTYQSSPSLAVFSTTGCTAGAATGYSLSYSSAYIYATSNSYPYSITGLASADVRDVKVGIVYGASAALLSYTYYQVDYGTQGSSGSDVNYYGFVLQLPFQNVGWYSYPSLQSLQTGCLDASTGVSGAWSISPSWRYVQFNFAAGLAAVYSDASCTARVLTLVNTTLAAAGGTGLAGYTLSSTAKIVQLNSVSGDDYPISKTYGDIKYASNGMAAFSTGLYPYAAGIIPSGYIYYLSLRVKFGGPTISVLNFVESPPYYYNFVLSLPCPVGTFASSDGLSCYTCTNADRGYYYNSTGATSATCPTASCTNTPQVGSSYFNASGASAGTNPVCQVASCSAPSNTQMVTSRCNTTADTGIATALTSCSAGYRFSQNYSKGDSLTLGTNGSCAVCSAGSYSNAANAYSCSPCTNAARGYYYNSTGASSATCPTASCTNTPQVGSSYFNASGASAGTNPVCQVASCTAPSSTQMVTSWCNTTADTGIATALTSCSAGYRFSQNYSNGDSLTLGTNGSCAVCSAGSYSDTANAYSCSPCTNAARGYYYNSTGVTSATCPTASCTNVVSGSTYYNASGANAGTSATCQVATCATPTPNTQYVTRICNTTLNTGLATAITTICAPGNYMSTPYSAGNATALGSDGLCSACPVGTFKTATDAATSCSPCTNAALGTYYNSTGVTSVTCPTASCTNVVSGSTYYNASGANAGTSATCQVATCATPTPNTQYVTRICNTTLNTGLATAITTTCAPGNYMSTPYSAGNATTLGADGVCSLCSSCPVGFYMTGCSGTSNGTCNACPPGSTTAVLGSTSISQCVVRAGYYGDSASATTLTQCNTGFACPGGGNIGVNVSTVNTACPANVSFSLAAGLASCTTCSAAACTAGTSLSGCGGASNGTCAPCSPGYYSAGSATSCTLCTSSCNAGSYLDGCGGASAGSCAACANNTYSAANAMNCTICVSSCNPGTYLDNCGGTSAGTCKNCSAGYASNVTGATSIATCTQCTANTSAAAGSPNCTECASGYISDVGAEKCTNTNCTACPGQYTIGCDNDNAGSCANCTLPTIGQNFVSSRCSGAQDTGFTPATVTSCSPGRYMRSRYTAGTPFSIGTDGECDVCLEGTYQNETNNTGGVASCIACPAGSTSPGTNNVALSNCVVIAGYYVNASNASQPVECDAGSYCPGGGHVGAAATPNVDIIPCANGSYSAGNASSCTPCGLGYFANSTGSSACTPCSVGFYANSTGSTSCFSCPTGSASASAGATALSSCALKQRYYIDVNDVNTPVLCLAGSRCPGAGYVGTPSGVVGITECEAGTWSSNGSTTCNPCANGTYSAAGAPSCTNCSNAGLGSYYSGVGTSASCPTLSCTNAVAGMSYYSASGAAAGTNTTCPVALCTEPNSTQYVTSACTVLVNTGLAASVTSCPAGQYMSIAYAPGNASAGGGVNGSCSTCAAGTFTSTTNNAASCTNCSAPNSTQFVTNACTVTANTGLAIAVTSCPAGQKMSTAYVAGTSAAGGGVNGTCTACAAGTFSTAGNTASSCSACTNANLGFYYNSSGTSATSCATTSCSNAVAGSTYYTATGTSAGASATCPTASCSAPGTGQFVSAPCTTTADTVSTTALQSCVAGTYMSSVFVAGNASVAGSDGVCTPCSPGSYSGPAALSCSSCLAGTFSGSGAATCTPCPAGYTSSGAAGDCPTRCAHPASPAACLGLYTFGSTGTTGCYYGNYAGNMTNGIWVSNSSTCTDCPSGTVSAGGLASTCLSTSVVGVAVCTAPAPSTTITVTYSGGEQRAGLAPSALDLTVAQDEVNTNEAYSGNVSGSCIASATLDGVFSCTGLVIEDGYTCAAAGASPSGGLAASASSGVFTCLTNGTVMVTFTGATYTAPSTSFVAPADVAFINAQLLVLPTSIAAFSWGNMSTLAPGFTTPGGCSVLNGTAVGCYGLAPALGYTCGARLGSPPAQCTAPVAGTNYAAAACNATNDTILNACRVCTAGSWTSATCVSGSTTGGGGSDLACAPCSACLSNQTQITACVLGNAATVGSNTVCATALSPPSPSPPLPMLPPPARTVIKTLNPAYSVNAAVGLAGFTKATFQDAAQTAFSYGMASALAVAPDDVEVTSVSDYAFGGGSSGRRMLAAGINIAFAVVTDTNENAGALISNIGAVASSPASLSAALQGAGLAVNASSLELTQGPTSAPKARPPPGVVLPVVNMIRVSPNASLVNPAVPITLSAVITSSAPASSLVLLWSVVSAFALNLSDPSRVGTPVNTSVLGLLPGALSPGASFIFRLSVRDAFGNASSSVLVNTMSVPANGVALSSSANGTELQTPFVFSTANWTDAYLPLQFSFSYAVLNISVDGVSSASTLLADFSNETTVSGVLLPAGTVMLQVWARNALGGVSLAPATTTVVVSRQVFISADAQATFISTLLSTSSSGPLTAADATATVALVSSIAGMLNDPGSLLNSNATAAADTRASLLSLVDSAAALATTPEALASAADAVNTLVSNASQINAAGAATALSVFETISGGGAGGTIAISPAASAGVAAGLSSVASAALAPNSPVSPAVLQRVSNVVSSLATSLLAALSTPGAAPVTVSSPLIQLSVALDVVGPDSRLFSAPLTAPGSKSSFAPLPADIFAGTSRRRRLLADDTGVRTQFSSLAFDPHTQDPNSTGTTTLAFSNSATGELDISGLSAPILFALPKVPLADGRKAQCQFWDKAAAAFSIVGCASLPDPLPRGHTASWKPGFTVASDAEMAGAWNFSGPLVAAPSRCLFEVLDCAAANNTRSVYPNPAKPFQFPAVRCNASISTEPILVISGSACALIQEDNAYGCYWNNSKHAFEGAGCVASGGPVQCACRHLTEFTGKSAPSLPTASLSDMVGLVRANLVSVAFVLDTRALTCLCLI